MSETFNAAGGARPRFRILPTQLVLGDGTPVRIRAITPDDEPRMVEFHQTLSAESIHARYFGMLSLDYRTGHNRLAAVCTPDGSREFALIAEHKASAGKDDILGIGRLSMTPGVDEAEFAVLVNDRWQGEGLGTALLKALVEVARVAKVRMIGHILSGNGAMLHAVRQAGFELRFLAADAEWKAELDLPPEPEIERADHAAECLC